MNNNYNDFNNEIPSNNYVNDINSNVSSSKNKNKLLIAVLILLCFAIGVGVFIYFKGKNTKIDGDIDLSSIYDSDKPIIIKKDGKYGYIKADGSMLIEPTYKSASDFMGNYAVVKIDNSNSTTSYKKTYQVIDKKGDIKMTYEGYSEPKYIPEYSIWIIEDELYDSKLNKLLEDGIKVDYIDKGYLKYRDEKKQEAGIITYKGKKIFSVPGDSIFVDICKNEYENTDLYASVEINGDTKKEVVVSLNTGEVLFTSEDTDKYYLMREENGLFYYYNSEEKDGYKNKKYLFFANNALAYQTTEVVSDVEVYDYKNKILEIDYGYDYNKLGKSSRYVYYDVKNQKVLETQPNRPSTTDDIMELTYGYKVFSSSYKSGLMLEDKIILPAEYDDIDFINESLFQYVKSSKNQELVLVEKDKKTSLINLKDKKELMVFDSTYVYNASDSTFLEASIYDKDTYKRIGYQIYNVLTGATITTEQGDDVSVKSNYITIKRENKTTYYNTKLEEIYIEES